MDKKALRPVVFIVSSLLVICGLFVTADYFAVFGTTVETKLDFAEVRFRTVDKESGNLIMNVGVRCFQKRNKNACTRRDSDQVGVVAVHIPVQRGIKKTVLFTKINEIYKSVDPKIHIMLIHQNYKNQMKTLLMEDVYSNKVSEQTVEMLPGARPDQEAEEE
jgi:hypothetical protein